MATTPTMPGAGYNENLYRGQAMAQLRILKQQMQLGRLNIGTRTVDFGNGVTCFCEIVFNDERVYVRIPQVAAETIILHFVVHPQTNSFPASVFPLVDGDHGTYGIDLDGKVTQALPVTENYGNIDGLGLLSWRGPSGKYLPNASDAPITGFLQSRRQPEGYMGDPFYTPFAELLYKKGGVATPHPPGYVLCSAIIAGVTWVVVQPLPESADQVLMNFTTGVWVEVARRAAYAEVPCVFQIDKIVLNNVVGGSGEWTLAGAWAGYSPDEGTLTRAEGWDVTKDITGIIIRPGVTITKYSTDVTGGSSDWDFTMGDVPAYTLNTNPLHWTANPEILVAGNNTFSVAGGTAPYTWSTSQGTITDGVIDSTGLCGSITITATDKCGVVLTTVARAVNGQWVAGADSSVNPVGWVTGEWHYNGKYRTKLVSVATGPTVWKTPIVTCPGYGADVSSTWANATTYYGPLGTWTGRPATGCGGATSGGIGSGIPQCGGGDFMGGQGYGGTGEFVCYADVYHGRLSGNNYSWRAQTYWQTILTYTCVTEEWVCN